MSEQNLVEGDEPEKKKPNTMALKNLQKIQNNRYLNQNIYQMFVLRKYKQCMQMIQRCQPDEYKLYMKSLIYKYQFELEKSLSLLNECEVMNKLNFVYLKGITKNFYLLGKYKSSLEAAKQAHRINSSDYEIFYIMAKISIAMKDNDSAIMNLNRSIAKQPNQESYILLSKLLMDKGSFMEAGEQLKKALSISPENDEIYQMLGQIQEKLRHGKQSIECYNKALQINPNRYETLFSIAAVKQANQQIEQALSKYSDAYKITQNSAAFWNNLSGVMLKKNKEIAVYSCLKKALYLDPFRYDIHINLGLILMKVKKYVGAQLHFRSALKLKKDERAYSLLGWALFELGDLTNAERCFEQIFKQSKNPKYKINYACLLAKKGQKQKCRQIINQIQSNKLSQQYRVKLQEIKSFI